MAKENKYTEQDYIESILKAEEKLGESPSAIQYKSLDITPSYATIASRYGWNKIKQKAGIKTCDPGAKIKISVPEILEMSEEEWIDSTTDKRAYLRDKSKLAKIKLSTGCEECGYDKHPDALDFHHINKEEKNFNVASFTKRNIPFEEVKEEIEKCKILCSNCHRQKEATYSFSVE